MLDAIKNRQFIELEDAARKTVGYAETANKTIFMDGVNVGIAKASDHYLKEIEVLKQQLTYTKMSYEEVTKDFSTLTDIISKYTH